jgi:hypothetical protein
MNYLKALRDGALPDQFPPAHPPAASLILQRISSCEFRHGFEFFEYKPQHVDRASRTVAAVPDSRKDSTSHSAGTIKRTSMDRWIKQPWLLAG